MGRKNNEGKKPIRRYLDTTEFSDYPGPINTNEYIPNVDRGHTLGEGTDESLQSIKANMDIPYDGTVNINEYIPNLKNKNTPRH